MRFLTIFADASVCHDTWAAGWGGWLKVDGLAYTVGGEIMTPIRCSNAAEFYAIANAFRAARTANLLVGVEAISLQSDNLEALGRLLLAGCRLSKPKNGCEIQVVRASPWAREEEAIEMLRSAVGLRNVWLRHVRGHWGREGRQWVNQTCDDIARRYMESRRETLRRTGGSVVET